MDALSLLEEISPAWVCDIRKVQNNFEILDNIQTRLSEATGIDVHILIALKGSSLPATFDLAKKYLYGCTASGLYEAMLGREMDKFVCTYSPAYKESEFEQLCYNSDSIVFNSISQYNKFKKYIPEHKHKGLRINPEISLVSTSIYNPCLPFSRFGMTIEELSKCDFDTLNTFKELDTIHFHALCKQNSDALEKILDKISVSFEKYLKQVTTINMGGGHAFTENYDVDRLERIIVKFCNKFPNIKTILFEPGEAILFDCGPLVTTVLDIMHNNMDVAILDVSSSAHLVDVLEMPYRPNVRLFKTQELAGNYGEKAYTYKFGGNTCLSGDVMGDFSFNTPLEPGDILLIEDQMHYSFVKSTFFNGVKHPDIYIKDRSNFIKVKEYKYSDFRDRLGNRL